ncbi:1-phosphatidylinositol-3-phosphate 5-kinase [Niveomyces insectorum RCEF 264]|uniref:1-phosphatidylinositol-3-phosphate 5-kinase n=1 Tax=Niveomyces insectorum RCEF 264 TaxID=1081102 RepID=A0A167UZE2_9HYPO|nr:1-phosphatidylinositol-3-phosphate 5-kinase [Niveomyces insectorum RCEF 264]
MSSSKVPPPSPATLSSPFDRRSRRDSATSQSVSSQIDKEQLAQALDKIHTSASQSDVLTTFNDFGPPPATAAAPDAEPAGPTGDMVQQGLSGFYSRLKEAVGVGGKASPSASASTTATSEPQDGRDGQNAAPSRPGAGAGAGANGSHTRSKSSVTSLPRAESSGATNYTLNSAVSSDLPTTVTSSSGGITTESHSQMPVSSKASSITTMSTTVSAAKPSSSSQGLQKLGRAPAPAVVDTANASGAVGLFKESARGSGTTRVLERGGTRLNHGGEPHHTPAVSPTTPGFSDAPSASSLAARTNSNPTLDGLSDSGGRNRTLAGAAAPYHSAQHLYATDPAFLAAPGAGGFHARQSRDDAKMPAVIDRLSVMGTPVGPGSPSAVTDPGAAEATPINTSAHGSVYHDSFAHEERPQQLESGQMRIPGTTTNEGAPGLVNARLEHMRQQVLSKEFWMADETCKECFLCGDSFSAFRRKHHCRTCGWIFDSKCTSTISGQKFGVPGNLRVCKTCLDVINRRYDSESDESDDPRLTTLFRNNNNNNNNNTATKSAAQSSASIRQKADGGDNGVDTADAERSTTTPMMAIPATRRIGNPSNRNSAILEIDAAPQLSRPSSSRSLKSLNSMRPPSSGHMRHHSKHNFHWTHKAASEDRVPFRKNVSDEMGRKSRLPAFHDDNIIDPELAPYMSDESSGDEQMSIFATLASNDLTSSSLDPDKPNFGPFLSAGRKHRSRGDKSISGLSFTSRGLDDDRAGALSMASHPRAPGRRRNTSSASVAASQHYLRSPRGKIGAGFKGPTLASEALGLFEPGAGSLEGGTAAAKLLRSTSAAKTEHIKLSQPSVKHIKRLFRQLLNDAAIPNPSAWERALIPVLRKCADDVDPNTREGDRMDIRHYVKLKKIPGGKPSDSSYVSGVIFTKNLALKSMPRRIAHPRILIVSFPIEYQRQQQQHQFMSLEPVMTQEKEFLKMVVARIRNHQPEVVLAQRNVAGLALQSLADAGIAVAYNVKASVIGAVSRCVGTPIISSMDMLSLPITVGRCAEFEVKTFVNNDIPGRKKTYIFLTGCEKFLGCTIALRGTSTELLSRMKQITEFMVYVVYSLKLESCLLRDESIMVPSKDAEKATVPVNKRQPTGESLATADTTTEPSSGLSTMVVTDGGDSLKTTRSDGDGSAQPSQTESAVVDGPKAASSPPNRSSMPQSVPSLLSLRQEDQFQIAVATDRHVPEDVPAPTFYSDMVEKYKTKILSASPYVKFTQPYLLMRAREQETRLLHLKRLRDQDVIEEEKGGNGNGNEGKKPQQQFQLINPEMVHEIGRRAPKQVMEVLHAVHDAEYDKALYSYQTMTRQWENYIQGNLDLFDPYSHQNIVVLYSLTCTETKIPCLEPGLIGIAFYSELPDPSGPMDADCTLGQYVQDLCEGAEERCHANGCDRPMWQHHRTYVHGEARVTFFVEPEARIPSGTAAPSTLTDGGGGVSDGGGEGENGDDDEDDEDPIYTWSYCKICKRDLIVKRLSSSAWKYSFGKYLELLFWGRNLRLADDAGCPHDCQKDHIRYFHVNGASVRIHYDPIDLLELVVPRARITWKVDHDLRLKNEIFGKTQESWNRFIASVKTRIKSIRIDSVLPDKERDCKAEVERLAKKAQEEHVQLLRELEQAYMQSKHYEIIPLNAAVRSMAEKLAEWDAAFAKFEADYLSDKDVRQLTVIQLRKMFTDTDSRDSLPAADGTSVATSAASAASESDAKTPSTAAPTTQNSFSELDEKSTPTTSQPADSEPHDVAAAAAAATADVAAPVATDQKMDGAAGAEQQPEAVIASDQVKSLDLATPLSSALTAPTTIEPVGSPILAASEGGQPPHPLGAGSRDGPIGAVTTSSATPTAPSMLPVPTMGSGPSAMPPRPLRTTLPPLISQPSLTEKVEQLRREFKAQSAELNEAAQALSKGSNGGSSNGAVHDGPSRAQGQAIATPGQRGPSRKLGPVVSPPMVRATSHPVGAVPRTVSSIHKQGGTRDNTSKPSPPLESGTSGGSGSSGTGTTNISTSTSGDHQKGATDNPTRVEKKFSDRIGLGALTKGHRKAATSGPSSIPRFVHKRDTKVTSLARHFEQLSREFEKERNKERKRQATHHPRAYFPKSSARATVEVYDSVDQAVQEPGPTDDELLFASQHSEARSTDSYTSTAQASGAVVSSSAPKATTKGAGAEDSVGTDAAAPSNLGPTASSQAPRSENVAAIEKGTSDAVPASVQQPPPSEKPAETDEQSTHKDDKRPGDSAVGSDDEDGGSDGDGDGDQLLEDILPDVETIAEHLEPSGTVPTELQRDKKSNLMKMLSNFWAERSASGWPQLEYPLKATDHIFIDSDVIVREDEPSSLIAFALSSEDYLAKLDDIRRQGRRAARQQQNQNGKADGGGGDDLQDGGDEADDEGEDDENADEMKGADDGVVVVGDGGDSMELVMKAGKTDANSSGEMKAAAHGETENVTVGGKETDRGRPVEAAQTPRSRVDDDALDSASDSDAASEAGELERSLLRPTGTHLKYQFTEGSARMMCKIFYAEQFDALRRKCGVADRIVESLSRCLKWDSKGGKTKSVFLKTLDDRLVMKSLSPIETAAFLDFAPSYFSIMAEALFHDLPSVIAKMLGFFQVIVKNAATGTEIKLDLLIMENLFYDRQETRKFDLKGSMRNRKIQSTGEQNEVLLDENMVEYIYESPLFAREHAKKLLRASVWNDTLFLARQNVMDYSLMVAVDEPRRELVVGIIDCIRTYTWDKKLESWIKDRGFVGGGRNRPTVTSPKEYKSRFREAMERYILQAPNCWHLFGAVHYTHPALAPRARFAGHADD